MGRVQYVFVLVMIVMAGLLIPAACSQSHADSGTIHVGVNAKEASLTEIWTSVVEKAGIQDVTASLAELTLLVGEDGSVEMLSYSFYSMDSSDHRRCYYVQSGSDGDVECYVEDTGTPFGEIHPLSAFEQLDKVSLASIQPGCECMIDMSFVSGAVLYQESACRLCQLENGELVPLKEVSFGAGTPWAAIQVSRLHGTMSGSAEFWFLSSELRKAESVKYA